MSSQEYSRGEDGQLLGPILGPNGKVDAAGGGRREWYVLCFDEETGQAYLGRDGEVQVAGCGDPFYFPTEGLAQVAALGLEGQGWQGVKTIRRGRY